MKKIVVGLLFFGLTCQVFSQIITLSEVDLTAVNYKYINAVDSKDAPIPVEMLENKVALYDIKKSELYNDEYDIYFVSFYIPEGKILAAYNKDGKLIRTIEKFKDVALPKLVRDAVFKRFPEWKLAKDSYRVNYVLEKEDAKKIYKMKLENGDKTLRVKTDENGTFI